MFEDSPRKNQKRKREAMTYGVLAAAFLEEEELVLPSLVPNYGLMVDELLVPIPFFSKGYGIHASSTGESSVVRVRCPRQQIIPTLPLQ
jgi:hypothetical protein